jgi:hypothetical protein
MFFISCSSIAYAPVFWAAAGTACVSVETAREKKAADKLAKKNAKANKKA